MAPNPYDPAATGALQVAAPADAAALRPVVDLDSGSVLAAEVVLPRAEGGDVDHAASLVRGARWAASLDSPLPLVLPLPASGLAPASDAVPLLERELRRAGRRPRDVTLMLGPGLAGLPAAALLDGVRRVRERGFRCGFGTAAVAPQTLVAAAPFLVRIDSDIVAGIPADERGTALVEGLARIGLGAGVFPLAAGVTSVAQAVLLRQVGIRLAQGPLFSGEGWRPGDRVRPLPDTAMAAAGPVSPAGPRVAEFMLPTATMGEDATSEAVLDAFTADTALNSVVLIDHRERPTAALDRVRFLLAITGPYGHALHARRPAARLADSPRTVARGLPALAALRAAGADRDRVYDDLVVVNEFGQCMGTVHVKDLISSMSSG